MIENLTIGLVSGVTASVVVWLFFSYALRPKISISDKIAKVRFTNNPLNHFYQIKIANMKSFVHAFDLEVDVRLRVLGLGHGGEYTSFKLPVKESKIRYLGPKSYDDEDNFRVTIKYRSPEGRASLNKKLLIAQVGDFPSDAKFQLEQVMQLSRSHIRILVTATDGFSGARRIFEKRFFLDDIIEGRFSRNSSRLHKYESHVSNKLL